MRRSCGLVVIASVVACGDASSTDATDPSATPGTIAAALACDRGERPSYAPSGGERCVAVGITSVPDGFTRDGWGFEPVTTGGCKGATMAKLGSTSCEPIDDCTRAFPPADATVAVRTNAMPYADRPDLPVVATLAEAIAKGGVIAVDEGRFDTPGSLTTAVRIVGKCAAKTILANPDFVFRIDAGVTVTIASATLDASTKVSVLASKGGTSLTLDSVYVRSLNQGLQLGNKIDVHVKNSVLEGPEVTRNPNAAMSGVFAAYGSKVAIEGSEIRAFQNAVSVQSKGTEVTIAKSVLHEPRKLEADAAALSQLAAFVGGRITVDGSLVESLEGRVGIVGARMLNGAADPTTPDDPPASVAFSNSALRAPLSRDTASVIDVMDGATTELVNVSMRHDSFAGIGASEGAVVTIRDSAIESLSQRAIGRSALVGLSRGSFVVESSALVDSVQSAVTLDRGSELTIRRSLVSGTKEMERHDFSVFLGAAQAIAVGNGGKVDGSDVSFVDNQGTALFVQQGTASLAGAVFHDTHASPMGPFSSAILGIDAVVLVRDSSLASNDRAIALRGGRALLGTSVVVDHKEALRLEGVSLVQTNESTDPEDAKLVAAKSTFERNATLVNSATLSDE